MKLHLSEMHLVHRMQLPHARAAHLHPAHWLAEHPIVVALVSAGLLAAATVCLARLISTGIRPDMLDPGLRGSIWQP
jgi:hypothetical protein